MSDANLRELERRWRETGSVEDEAAWLLQRLRVGELDEERLRLAAYCSHEPSRIALDLRPLAETGSFGLTLRPGGLGRQLLTRVSVDLCLEVLGVLESHRFHGRCLEAIEALEGWIADPSSSRAGRARRLADRCSWDRHDGSTERQLTVAQLIFWTGRIPLDLWPWAHVAKAAEDLRLDFKGQTLRVALGRPEA